MPKNFNELRDDLVERVGEDRLAQARHEADEEVERYEKTLRQIREALKRTQTDMAGQLGTSQAEVSRLERRKDMYLSTLGRYVAALGGRLEVQVIFDDADVTVPLMIGGDIGPAADSALDDSNHVPSPTRQDLDELLGGHFRTDAGSQSASEIEVDRGTATDKHTDDFLAVIKEEFDRIHGPEREKARPRDHPLVYSYLAPSARRCAWEKRRRDAVSDVLPAFGNETDAIASAWWPPLRDTVACHALVSRESSKSTDDFARFLAGTVKPTLMWHAIILAAPARQALPIRTLIATKRHKQPRWWSGCAVPVGVQLQEGAGDQVDVLRTAQISWQNAERPDETFTARLDQVELLEACAHEH
jgi:transcriptional regulator with XRE-family HTH domain